MLAPRASSAFVCILCELQLARPTASALARRQPRATFSTSSAALYGDGDAFDRQAPRLSSRLSTNHLGKQRRRKGIQETTARLGGVKTLGHDAEILVLKQVGRDPPPYRDDRNGHEVPSTIATLPKEVPSLLASLGDNTTLSPAEIVAHLESLRPQTEKDPSEPHYIGHAHFVKLQRVLIQGFTVPQLARYYSVAKDVQQDQVQQELIVGLTGKKGTAKRPIERTEWHPGTTQLNRRLPGLDVLSRPKRKAVSKQLLVDQILRDVWKLVLLEEIEAPGEIELSLKSWQLSLLNAGSPTCLDRIGRERKARLEIYWPHHALRITADKTTAEYAADDVESQLQTTEALRFNLAPWAPFLADDQLHKKGAPEIFPPKSLETIAMQSGAIAHVVSSSQLIIRALDKTSAEEAKRCLFRMLPWKSPAFHTIDARRVETAKNQAYLLPTTFESSLDYPFRDLDLARWSLPLGKSSDDDPNHKEDPVPNNIDSLTRAIDALRPYVDETSLQPLPKQVPVHTKYAVHFGQVLFPSNGDVRTNGGQDQRDLIQLSTAPFSCVFPGLSQLLKAEDLSVKYHTDAPSLEYDFALDPAHFTENDSANHLFWPRLSIQVRCPPGKQPFVYKAAVDFNKNIHDVLLPDRAVDLRFETIQKLDLLADSRNESIAQFEAAVRTNIESGARLTAPSSIKIQIPKCIIPGYDRSNTGLRSVAYCFTGIRFRQTVVSKLEEVQLALATMHSGKLGWKSSMLSAYPYMSRGISQNLDDFVKESFKVADRITNAASATNTKTFRKQRPKDQADAKQKPRDENSARRLRRRTLQDTVGQEMQEPIVLGGHLDVTSLEGEAEAPVSSRIPEESTGQPSPHTDDKAPVFAAAGH